MASQPALTATAAGLASGALTTSISVSGPPLVLWLESRGVAAKRSCGRRSPPSSWPEPGRGCALLVPLAGPDRIALSAGVLVPLLALVVAGHFAGARAFERLDPRRFSLAVLALVALTGVASVAAGVAAL